MLLVALAPGIERVTPLSAAFAALGTAVSLQLCAAGGAADWPKRLRRAGLRLVGGSLQLPRDLSRRRAQLCRRSAVPKSARWIVWIAPSALLAGFSALFAQANPVFAGWLTDIPVPSWADIGRLVPRGLFWLAVLVKLWPAIRARRPPPAPGSPHDAAAALDAGGELAALLLSPAAVLRALLLLDALFALQLGLDGAYLSGGVALPEGLSYAGYAHRGAYPLVATALLAAGLVLVIRRRGAPPPGRLASSLLLAFLAQNVLLVGTAAQRLSLYVGAYGLTELRVAAFAWMGLVAVGLGLVMVQGALGRDSRWLVVRCALAAIVPLYGWCFLDAPRIVADYDVAHCAELRGDGPELDTWMVRDLGPDALPAMDRYLLGFASGRRRGELEDWRDRTAAAVRREMADPRSWSWRGWRLARYLDASGVPEPAAPPAADGEEG